MSNDKSTADEIARATLDSIEMVRRACEGKPPRKPMPEMPHASEDVPAWLGGMFDGKGGK